MKSPRSNWMFEFARGATSLYVNGNYNIQINGVENFPKEGPVLVAAKHCRYSDIPVEGEIARKAGRNGNWIMKHTLPHCFEKVGGIMVYRQDEIRSGLKEFKKSGQNSKEFKTRVKQMNERAFALTEAAYARGEPLFLHPEGHTLEGEMGDMNMALIDYTYDLQKKLDVEIPLVVVGLEYSQKSIIPWAVANVERLDWEGENLEGRLKEKIAKLSGF